MDQRCFGARHGFPTHQSGLSYCPSQLPVKLLKPVNTQRRNHSTIIDSNSINPDRPYTPMRGALSNVWFDRYKISQDCPENLESIDIMAASIGKVIEEEIRAGVPKNRIIIGGFSMGGAMALHLACRYQPDVAGVFALSSFLNKDSAVYPAVEKRAAAGSPLPELFQCHGTRDELVSHMWGEGTVALLKKAGMTASFHSFSGLQHQLSRPEMELLHSWILTKLPPNS
ncbi:lysophospholipase-like protein 1 isoform X2 [Esox lucius]|uniref:palmitoyl-protein hydrolase n=1 Tax=Esox lucius TaxID=8010 RepID=A0A6Q2XPS9_ESOLU|nr:lysophospholipase-like protein 1 isoform X2 [Esox lucius]